MKENLKYMLSIIFSQLACSLIFFIFSPEKASLLKGISLFLLLITVVFQLLRYKEKKVFPVASWVITFGCILIFWIADNPTQEWAFNEFSVTACIFLIVNTIFCIVSPHTKPNVFFGIRTLNSSENPVIWSKVHHIYSLIASFFELPLFLLIFYVSGVLKFILCIICLLASVILALILGELSTAKMIKQLHQKEEDELNEQIRKEEGYR